jgi:hypothetical protein
MTHDGDDKTAISPPKSYPARNLTRTIVEGVAELVPGASIATGALRELLPSKEDQARADWEGVITERTNVHTERLDAMDTALAPQAEFTGAAAELIAALARNDSSGMAEERYTPADLAALVPGADPQMIEDAAYDLKSVGLVELSYVLSGPKFFLRLADSFYEQIDHQVMGWNTREDAVTLAKHMLADDRGDARELHTKTGWERRRFNPAFAYLLPLFPEGRVRRVLQPDYPSLGVAMIGEDRAALRRFLAAQEG